MHIKGICVFRLQFTEQDRLLRVVCWFWSGFSLVDHQNEQKMSQVRQRDLGVNMAHQSPPSGLQGSTGRTSRDRPQSMPAFPAHGLLPRQETKVCQASRGERYLAQLPCSIVHSVYVKELRNAHVFYRVQDGHMDTLSNTGCRRLSFSSSIPPMTDGELQLRFWIRV
eukprot:gb/GECG01016355.1/.p1 GENE.gb/GECG01016355.1/~~gb/GECG01016355.1/.p1  ORF type:complete len:167 (+),score=9.24 gb/GECG01016355.1/:1-501(+)